MNTKSRWIFSVILVASLAALASAGTISIPLVTVGDPGNVADPATGYGSVPYTYSIGEYDVTIGDYTAFLNAVAQTDTYGLYNTGMALRPVGSFYTLGIGEAAVRETIATRWRAAIARRRTARFTMSPGGMPAVHQLARKRPADGGRKREHDGDRDLLAQRRDEQPGIDAGQPQPGQHLGSAHG